MIDGIPNRPLYFYQKDIIGIVTHAGFSQSENLHGSPFRSTDFAIFFSHVCPWQMGRFMENMDQMAVSENVVYPKVAL